MRWGGPPKTQAEATLKDKDKFEARMLAMAETKKQQEEQKAADTAARAAAISKVDMSAGVKGILAMKETIDAQKWCVASSATLLHFCPLF